MQDQCNESAAAVQSKLRCASSLVLDLLLPLAEVSRICGELEYSFRDRVFNPMVVVWMFISQVLSADHSCQQAVTRFNAWRIARGLARVSSETTSYRKARGKLPEQLFERLLAWTSKRCDLAGAVIKLHFGDTSGVYPSKYLQEFESGSCAYWNTPRLYKQLDGKGRKLLFYDSTRLAITAEAEIERIEENVVTGSVTFGSHRGAYRNLTHQQYSQLVSCTDIVNVDTKGA